MLVLDVFCPPIATFFDGFVSVFGWCFFWWLSCLYFRILKYILNKYNRCETGYINNGCTSIISYFLVFVCNKFAKFF